MKNKALYLSVILTGLLMPVLAQAQTTPPPRSTPAEVKRGWFENRRIMIEVRTDSAFAPTGEGLRQGAPSTFPFGEHFGVRIGNVVPMRVNVFVLKPQNGERKIEVDFNPLKAGRLSIDPDPDPDFRLASAALLPEGESPVSMAAAKDVKLQLGDNEYDAELYEIRLYVQTMRQPQPMRFAIEFAYAASDVNGAPDWKRIWSPDFILSMSKTADEGSDLSAGNTNYQAQNPPFAAGLFFVILGTIWVITPISFIAIRAIRRRLTSERLLDPEELAWLKLEPIFEDARVENGYSFNETHVRGVVGAVLEYVGKPTLTSRQLEALVYEDDDGELLIAILRPLLEGVMEGKLREPLSAESGARIVERIGQLIPKA
jgi:hypothetical protein